MDLKVGDKIIVDFVEDDQEPPVNDYYHNATGVVTELLPAPNRYHELKDVVRLDLARLGDVFLYTQNVKLREDTQVGVTTRPDWWIVDLE